MSQSSDKNLPHFSTLEKFSLKSISGYDACKFYDEIRERDFLKTY